MNEPGMTNELLLLRLAAAALIGAIIGYERRMHQKAIGISGMMLVAVGSTTFMLLAKHESATDASAVSRTLQGLLQGIGFLGGAVIFKGGTDVKGIKTAAAIWITGAIGMAIATGFWWLGLIVGCATAAILFVADLHQRENAEEEEEEQTKERIPGKAA
ncbi:MAG TPA: MgtC/SapB family protein [Herpetosiphonaceae bacterium]|nr:MgtC/SapB family protein [Herpetosiphonaceae bacterium]